jgi:uncharacterized membrane protein
VTKLVAAASFFFGIHTLVAGTALRRLLVERLGERVYRAVFSLASLVGIVWLIRAYSAAFARDNVMFWEIGPAAHYAVGVVVLLAFLIAVPGVLAPSPTVVGGERLLQASVPEPRGMQRVTRHPFLTGTSLWATAHLAANGDLASIVLFTTFLAVSLFGMRSIDNKRARAYGDGWRRYAERTSAIPFVAIVQGRNRLVLRELGGWRVVAALVVFGVVVTLHPWLFGAYPLPGMND